MVRLRPDLEDQINRVPDLTGVYLLRDESGVPLYIGKALSLKNRLRSHFHPGKSADARTLQMLNRTTRIDYITTGSEVESLILESNLVKEHKPEYNIRLRDDKHFPYLRIDLAAPYPRVEVVRRMAKDGARYFGPYTRAGSVRETLRTLRRVFPYRICSDYRLRTVDRPCLDHHIRRCLAPCTGNVDPGEYRSMMEEMCLFLEGRQSSLVSRLRGRMSEASERLEFEKAAEIRDQVRAVEDVMERQAIISDSLEDQDVLGYAVSEETGVAAVQVFHVREGKVVGRDGFILDQGARGRGTEILAAFIKQHYGDGAVFVPGRLLVPEALRDEEREPIEKWLSETKGSRVKVQRPARGVRRDLVRLAADNAALVLQQEELNRLSRERGYEIRAGVLGEALGLGKLPERIEGFDISNLHGQEAVGSMVVFRHGRPAPEAYRRFRVRRRAEPDDYAMMREVLYRRLRHLGAPTAGGEPGDSPPDLILIDGGKGHLSAALEVLQDLRLDLPVLSLAKEEEAVYLPGRSDPLILPPSSPALHLLRNIRDEAHRFAVGYHRLLRRKGARRSVLDDVPGVGPRRRTALLKAFGSGAGVRQATLDELAAVPGIGRAAATKIWEHFHGGEGSASPGNDSARSE